MKQIGMGGWAFVLQGWYALAVAIFVPTLGALLKHYNCHAIPTTNHVM